MKNEVFFEVELGPKTPPVSATAGVQCDMCLKKSITQAKT